MILSNILAHMYIFKIFFYANNEYIVIYSHIKMDKFKLYDVVKVNFKESPAVGSNKAIQKLFLLLPCKITIYLYYKEVIFLQFYFQT